jgi:hypothetical protein
MPKSERVTPLEWPEEDPSATKRRKRRNWMGVPGRGNATVFIDFGADEGPAAKGGLLRAALPFLFVAAILVLIGLILAITGPLPRVFPALG